MQRFVSMALLAILLMGCNSSPQSAPARSLPVIKATVFSSNLGGLRDARLTLRPEKEHDRQLIDQAWSWLEQAPEIDGWTEYVSGATTLYLHLNDGGLIEVYQAAGCHNCPISDATVNVRQDGDAKRVISPELASWLREQWQDGTDLSQ